MKGIIMNKKAIVLLSGGLDSSLAAKLMLDQGIDVVALNFTSPFCTCTPRKSGCRHQASVVALELGIEIKVLSKGMDYLEIVKNPPHGHGRGMNPCIDCRIYILRKAREMMAPLGASFVVTGEVLGQRPMSQHRQAIKIIEKESGLEGLILRPLSAGLFEPTRPEQEGVVDREKLLSIAGRSRKPQIELAADMGLRDYPCPAGGCLLTDRVVASRLRDLFARMPGYGMDDIHLLKIGRHFRISPSLKVVVGRNQSENQGLEPHVKTGYALFHPESFRGPAALACGMPGEDESLLIGGILARYSQDEHRSYVVRRAAAGGTGATFAIKAKLPPERVDALLIGPGEAAGEAPCSGHSHP
jgi:tRNA-uridine 2-sulfurtransferase